MSLLMEALRKAEEAKRLSANKEKEGNKEGASAAVALRPDTVAVPAAEKPDTSVPTLSLEEVRVEPQSFSPAEPSVGLMNEELEVALAAPVDLDIPFDFHIDESFGLHPEPSVPQTEPQSPAPLSATNDVLALDIPLEFSVEPEAPAVVPASSTTELLDAKPAAYFPELELLEAQELVAKDVKDLPSLALEQAAALNKVPQPKVEAKLQAEPVPQRERRVEKVISESSAHTLRALRDDNNQDERAAESAASGAKSAKKAEAQTAEAQKRQTARAVFNAKANARASSSGVRKYVPLAALVLLVLAGGGAYLYLSGIGGGSSNQYNIPAASLDSEQYQFPEQGVADLEMPVLADVSAEDPALALQPDALAVDPLLASVSTEPAVVLSAEETVAVNPQVVAAPLQDAAQNISQEAPASVVSAPLAQVISPAPVVAITPAVAVATDAPAVAEINVPVQATAVAEPEPSSAAIRVLRTDTTPQINPQIVLAYAAFQQQNYLEARAHYQQALLNQPTNRDALLGLAAIALKTGDSQQARSLYTKLLELDPRDALAQVGLMETMPASDPQEFEYTLKRLFSEHPDIAPLAFSLGNLYASQGRWNEAQQSYYDALLSAKASASGAIAPDYAFNLAVSLERLNQLPAAYNFYREALTLSQNAQYAFDIRVLRERLDAIERVLP